MAGKVLSIIAGIITLLSTFLLVWFLRLADGAHGAGLAMIIINMFSNVAVYAFGIGVPEWAVYIIAIGAILFLLAGIFQLIGAKVRVLGIIGSLLPLGLAILIILGEYNVIPGMMGYLSFMAHPMEFVPGILPYYLDLGGVSIGTYALLLGGLLGLIAGFMKRD